MRVSLFRFGDAMYGMWSYHIVYMYIFAFECMHVAMDDGGVADQAQQQLQMMMQPQGNYRAPSCYSTILLNLSFFLHEPNKLNRKCLRYERRGRKKREKERTKWKKGQQRRNAERHTEKRE